MNFLLLVAIVALAAFPLYAVLRTAWRLMRDDGRLRLAEALRGQGLAFPAIEDQFALRSAALATRRCVACSEHLRCDQVLAERDWKGLRAICPNTPYFGIARTPR